MSQIEELQSRITAAMDRIGTGLSALSTAQDAAEQDDLKQALDDERTANAQLEERVKTLNAQLADVPPPVDNSQELEALQAEVELLRNEVGNQDEKDALKAEVARLKQEMEEAGNTAALEAAESTAVLETKIAGLNSELAALQTQLDESAARIAADNTEALTAEINNLKTELEEAKAEIETEQPTAEPEGNGEELARQNETLVRLDTELQQLRHANESLRSANTALRDANAAGLGDAGLINSAMEAEIEGLRAAQASDQAQVNAVLAKLEPLLAKAKNLPEGEEV